MCKGPKQGKFGTDEELKEGQHDWLIMRERVGPDETGELGKKGEKQGLQMLATKDDWLVKG